MSRKSVDTNNQSVFPSEMSANFLGSLGAVPGQAVIPIDKKVVAIGRIGDEKDMGGTVLYMVSRAGAYLNGNVIVVDGGRLGNFPTFY